MSTLTKVFVLLVSLLAIFLCGAVVTFVSNVDDWRGVAEEEASIREAAQLYAETVETAKRREIERFLAQVQRLKETNIAMLERIAELNRDLDAESLSRAEADKKVASAVELGRSVQQANQNLLAVEQSLQAELARAYSARTTAETQMISLNQQLNIERAKNEQLESLRRRKEEEIYELENENARIRRQLQEVTVSAKEFRPAQDLVSMTQMATPAGVPIRGEILDIRDGTASISVGSASGVREGTKFQVVRSGLYVASLEVQMVEATQAAGRLVNIQGEVVVGDKVTTGFD